MNTKIQKPILGGIIGTAIMTMVMFVAPMIGMPKMSPTEMLSGMLGMPVVVGWTVHFYDRNNFLNGLRFFSLSTWLRKLATTF